MTQIGQQKMGETLVVAGASGPAGANVGQIGKILGLHVVGIAGGKAKCNHVINTLEFDICIECKANGFSAELKATLPDGIDIYFENVGGDVFDAILPLLNAKAHIPVCGLISHYNATALPNSPYRMNLPLSAMLSKRMSLRGFIVFDDFGHLYPEFAKQMAEWVKAGKVKFREEMIVGLERAPAAFVGLLKDEAFGKWVVKLTA